MAAFTWKRQIVFFSQGDENAFFSWLQGIEGIESVQGAPEGLIIGLEGEDLPEMSLRELLAIYRRYDGDMKELAVFLRPDNESWFKKPGSYWYGAVFGG